MFKLFSSKKKINHCLSDDAAFIVQWDRYLTELPKNDQSMTVSGSQIKKLDNHHQPAKPNTNKVLSIVPFLRRNAGFDGAA